MGEPVQALVRRVSERVRFQEFNDARLRELCYEEFIKEHPPEPIPSEGDGMLRLDPGANEREGAEPPAAWRLFMGDVSVQYDHTTQLPWAIAGELATAVRERVQREPFELVLVCIS